MRAEELSSTGGNGLPYNLQYRLEVIGDLLYTFEPYIAGAAARVVAVMTQSGFLRLISADP
jgi:hypothetical protein